MPSTTDNSLDLDDASSENITLQLKPKDGNEITISREIAMQSELIKKMWEGDKTQTTIELPNVKSSILPKILNYMEHHHNNPAEPIEKPLKSLNMRKV